MLRTFLPEMRKKNLPVCKKVVSLHPLSTKKRPLAEGCGNGSKDIEMMRSGDSVCRTAAGAADVETPNEFRYKKSNSYNEEFDPGSG